MSKRLLIISFLFNIGVLFSNDIYDMNISFDPVVYCGSHINGVGINGEIGKNFNVTRSKGTFSPGIDLFASSSAYLSNLGIPDRSLSLNIGTTLNFNWGNHIEYDPAGNREITTHTIQYYISYYFSTDGTSQPYGGVKYKLGLRDIDLAFSLDNDDAYAFATDKYRTTKSQIKILKYTDKNFYGAGVSFLLWTGNLDGTEIEANSERRNNSYTLDGYGGDYSHGILKLDLFYNNFSVSLGYDSETIRDTIQNGWHYFYNRPEVPLVDRDDRFFFQVTYKPSGYGYL